MNPMRGPTRSKNNYQGDFSAGDQYKGNYNHDYSSGGFKSPGGFSSGSGLLNNYFSGMQGGMPSGVPNQQMQMPQMQSQSAMNMGMPPQRALGVPGMGNPMMGGFAQNRMPGIELGGGGFRSPMQGGGMGPLGDYFSRMGKNIIS